MDDADWRNLEDFSEITSHSIFSERIDFMQPSSSAEQLLIDKIRKGDPGAWEECIALYEGRLQAFALRRLSDVALAEDIVQETFLGFLTSLPNYDSSTPLERFLFSITAHKITDALRRQGRRPTVSLPTSKNSSGGPRSLPGPGRAASSLLRSQERVDSEETQIAETLSRLITQWKRDQSYERLQTLELLFVCGCSNKVVASRLQIDEQAVANHKQFLLKKLKKFATESTEEME